MAHEDTLRNLFPVPGERGPLERAFRDWSSVSWYMDQLEDRLVVKLTLDTEAIYDLAQRGWVKSVHPEDVIRRRKGGIIRKRHGRNRIPRGVTYS